MFDRPIEADGMNFWLASMTGPPGNTVLQVANGLFASAEGLRLYPAGLSNHDFVQKLLTNAGGRAPTEAEIAPYVTQLATKSRGEVTLSLIAAMADGASADLLQMSTRQAFNGKVLSALNNVAAQAATSVATAATVNTLLTQIKAAQPVDKYVGSVVASTLTQVQSGAARGTNQLTVDRWGNVLSVSDLRDPNWKVSYTYNYDNQQLNQTLNALAGTTAAASKTGYDALGRKVSTTDFNNNTSTLRYDSNGNVALETHADGGTVAYRYNLFGDRTSVRTVRGAGQIDLLTNYVYDDLGHITSVWTGNAVDMYIAEQAGQRYMYAQYKATGNLWQQIQFDALGRSIFSTDGSGNKTVTAYDLDGNVTA